MKYRLLLIAIAAVFFGTAAVSGSSSRVDLIGEVWDSAAGEAVITDVENDEKEIRVEASGLQPNSVYSIWLIDDTPMLGELGIGSGDLTFETDSEGNGSYTVRLPSRQFKDWDKIEILHHPNNDTEDLAGAELALLGDLWG
jgi:hypothetical protein